MLYPVCQITYVWLQRYVLCPDSGALQMKVVLESPTTVRMEQTGGVGDGPKVAKVDGNNLEVVCIGVTRNKKPHTIMNRKKTKMTAENPAAHEIVNLCYCTCWLYYSLLCNEE